MTRRAWIAVVAWTAAAALAIPLAFTGCGSSADATLPAAAGQGGHSGHAGHSASTASPTGALRGPEHTPGMVMPDGSTMTADSAPSPTPSPSAAEPSLTSRMVCAGDVVAAVKQLGGLSSNPVTTSTWKNSLFTCTYRLPEGDLVLSVKESADPQAARAYFDGLQAGAPSPTSLEGLRGLGLPSFETQAGTVAFVKDAMTLLVDATRMPPLVGPQGTARTSFAFAVAGNVLACWKEHAAT